MGVVGDQDHARGPLEGTGALQHTPLCGGLILGHPHGRGPGLGTATNSLAGCGADPARNLMKISWAFG